MKKSDVYHKYVGRVSDSVTDIKPTNLSGYATLNPTYQTPTLIVIHKFVTARHFGMDCRNPVYMDVFKLAIPGTGYPLPGGYDELLAYSV